jgi:hypothetical protein
MRAVKSSVESGEADQPCTEEVAARRRKTVPQRNSSVIGYG